MTKRVKRLLNRLLIFRWADNSVLKVVNIRFKEEIIEKQYKEYFNGIVSGNLSVMFFLASALILLFAFFDRVVTPHSDPSTILSLRIILVVFLLITFLPRFKNFRPYTDFIVCVLFYVTSVVMQLIYFNVSELDLLAYYGYYGGMIMVMMGVFNFIFIRFIPAILTSIAILATYFILGNALDIENIRIANVASFYIGCLVLGILGVYQLDVLLRMNFYNHLQLKEQHKQILVQQKNIYESIEYASYIQKSMLPEDSHFKSILPNHFIFYRPKDILSGDFYWIHKVKNKIVLVCGDCTGHGVPGAMMSMLAITLLNEIVIRKHVLASEVIVKELRESIIATFDNSKMDIYMRDGVDVSVCVIDEDAKSIHYSGSFSQMYMIRNKEVVEIKGNKITFGHHYSKNVQYNVKAIQCDQGDKFYLVTDGFLDQFSEKHNKKMKKVEFYEILLQAHTLGFGKQSVSIGVALEQFMGKRPQTDDILVVGFEV